MKEIKFIFESSSYAWGVMDYITSIITIFIIIIIFLIKTPSNSTLKKISIFLIVAFSGMIVYGEYSGYITKKKVQEAFQKGTYNIVEGKIENFYAMPKSGHDTERFDVQGVHFEIIYTGNKPTNKTLFYTLTKNMNGPITHNGQKVKLYYIKAGAFDLCLPFLSHCLEFNRATENKIIKMWVYD